MASVANRDKGQLPRGRHSLSREEVEASQRQRIHAGMIHVVATRGYGETRVVDVIDHAGVSRRTFYELFEDKEQCFLATYDMIIEQLLGATSRDFEAQPDADWATRVRRGLRTFIALVIEQHEAARFCIVEALAAGPKALSRRDAAIRQFTHFLDAGRYETSIELPGLTSLGIAGGMMELLYTELIHGSTAHLRARFPELIFWVVSPYLGPERAARERDIARREQSGE